MSTKRKQKWLWARDVTDETDFCFSQGSPEKQNLIHTHTRTINIEYKL